MKKSLIVAAMVFSLSVLFACGDLYAEELQGLRDMHDALSDLASDFGIDLPDLGDIIGGEPPADDSGTLSGYSLLPIEALLATDSESRRYRGNLYYAEGLITDIGYFSDGKEYIQLLPFLEENELWSVITIRVNSYADFYGYYADFQDIRFYFEFVGFSDELESTYGYFKAYELLDLFS
jgi:hypothetical protein